MTKHLSQSPRWRDGPRHVFHAPTAGQFSRAVYLEVAFHKYAASIGCAIVQDAFMATTEQATLLSAWWAENRMSK